MKTTVDLHVKLQQYNEVTPEKAHEELILKEANKILDSGFNQDLEILTRLGIADNVQKAQSIKKNRDYLSNFDEVYDISAIKKLAINYRLRFLPSRNFSGAIDPLMPVKVREFCNKHGIYPNQYSDMFYILAPSDSFKLKQRPKDPILFYKINSGKYAFIHKWGNDFSPFRKLLNFHLRSIWHCLIFWYITQASVLYYFAERTKGNTKYDAIIIALLLGALAIALGLIFFIGRSIFIDKVPRFSDDSWDNEYYN